MNSEEIKEHSIINQFENSNISLNLTIPPIPKLKNQAYSYLCPKCHTFPVLQLLNEEYISYKCSCTDIKGIKLLKIKDLFDKEKRYMTFINESESDNEIDNYEKFNEKKGLKCINHNSSKNNEFRYYCRDCKENICKECVQNHLNNENHSLNFMILLLLISKILKHIKKLKK